MADADDAVLAAGSLYVAGAARAALRPPRPVEGYLGAISAIAGSGRDLRQTAGRGWHPEGAVPTARRCGGCGRPPSPGRRDDGPVREPQHDEAQRGELGVPRAVPLEPDPVEAVGRPAVALQHDRAVDDPEVDLVAGDHRVELGRRQAVAGEQPAHRRLEDAVDRLAVEHPVGSAARSAGTPGRPRRLCRAIAAQSAAGDAMPVVTTWPTAPGTAAGSRAPRSHSVRRMFVVGMFVRRDRRQVEQVTGSVDRRAGDSRSPCGCAEAAARRRGRRLGGDAPQPRRRAVRGHRSGPGGQHRGADHLVR